MYCFREISLSLYSVRRGGNTACEIAGGGGDLQKYGEWNTAAYTRYDPSSGQNWQNRLRDILNAQYGAYLHNGAELECRPRDLLSASEGIFF